MRVLRIFLVLAVLVLIPFLIWGGKFMTLFEGQAAREFVLNCGAWGWAVVIALLVGDLFLPIPATGVMSAAGYVYGPWIGGIISVTGSFLSGMLAFTICRTLGRRAARWLAGEKGLEENEAVFRRGGPWLIALSRWLPILPEVVACLAGLTRMRTEVFVAALLCGAVPMGFCYAAVGALFEKEPAWALGLSVAMPVVLWLVVRPMLRHREAEAGGEN